MSSQDFPQYPHLMKMTNRQEKVFHKPLLKGNSGLDLFVHVKDGKPFLFYILDKKERVVLMSEETKTIIVGFMSILSLRGEMSA